MSAAEVRSETLTFQIAETSALVWIAWALLAALIGVFLLVLNNPGCGVPMDYLTWLIWGVGLPTAGQPLTASSGALGITMPNIPRDSPMTFIRRTDYG